MQQTQTSLIKSPKFATNKSIKPKENQAFSFLLNKVSHLKNRKSEAEFLGVPAIGCETPNLLLPTLPNPKTSEVAMMKRLFLLGGGCPKHQQTRTQL